MKVSTKTRYGLRIILQLAEVSSDEGAVKGRDIVSKQGISEPYMEQIMIKLRKAGWVVTERGCKGGYKLNVSSEDITILDFIELFEGSLELVSCNEKDKRCMRLDECEATSSWQMLAESFRREAAKISVSEIIKLNSETQEYVI
jgi:Rrf2 family transcriptional regulator, cysteine metabolism repressor